MNLNDVFTAAPKLFAAFPEVAISSPFEERITGSVVFESLRKILQVVIYPTGFSICLFRFSVLLQMLINFNSRYPDCGD